MTKKLTTEEIINVIDTLVGEVIPIGDSNADEEILENFQLLCNITNHCLDSIICNYETKGAHPYSIQLIGKEAKKELNTIKSTIDYELQEGATDI